MSKVKITGNASGTGTLTIAAPNTNTDRTLDIPDAAGDLVVAEGGTFKIDSSGNVGIGTSSPSDLLHVYGGSLRLQGLADGAYAKAYASGGDLHLEADAGNNGGASKTVFSVDGTEKMRINSSGQLLINRTNPKESEKLSIMNNTGAGVVALDRQDNIDGNLRDMVKFYRSTTLVGKIACSNTATSYITSSDYRLKTDVQPMTGSTERLKALKPVNFEWISSGERVDGFIAHEVQEVVPESVQGEKDAMRTEEYEVTPAVLDDDGNVVTEAVMGEREVPDYQGIDQSKLVPLLVATIQELEARIAALEAV